MNKLFSTMIIVLVLSFGIKSYAQTPDGETPAVEMGCDGLIGAAFGLCNSYCEALDCNTDIGYGQHPNACDQVLGNYQKKTGYAGPPCDCDNVCQDEYTACLQNCTDKTCKDNCCRKRSSCQSRCCIQKVEQSQALYDRCVKECKGDQTCIDNNCNKSEVLCKISLCSI